MEHGITLLAIIHICVALLLITFVLIQDSKGGAGGAFGGGGSSQTLFGATGAVNFLVKITRALAIIFMCTCMGLGVLLSRKTSHSVTDKLGGSASSAPIPNAVPGPVNGVGAGGGPPTPITDPANKAIGPGQAAEAAPKSK
jgi:preprotein translocase subunit SecG